MNGFHHNEVGSVKKLEAGDTYKTLDIDNQVEHMLKNTGKDHLSRGFDIDKRLDEMFDEFKDEIPDIDARVQEYINKSDNLTEVESETPAEMTREQSIEQQDKVIDEVESGDKKLETNPEKGNYGEMKTDQDLREKGYKRISKDIVTSLDDENHQGIDGVYYNENGNPQYIIVDAKYGTAQLSKTQDGKQMSETWINNRLDQSIGKERADEIRLEKVLNPDNVGSYVSHIDNEGNVTYDKLDENGNVIEKDVNIND